MVLDSVGAPMKFTLFESGWAGEFRALLDSEARFWERWFRWADNAIAAMKGGK